MTADPHAVVVYDVPLLSEVRGKAEFDVVVVVSAPEEARISVVKDFSRMGIAPPWGESMGIGWGCGEGGKRVGGMGCCGVWVDIN